MLRHHRVAVHRSLVSIVVNCFEKDFNGLRFLFCNLQFYSLQALPGLSTYAATKAGLKFWNDALRVEMKQYGVQVVNFIPGSYVMSTNITERQMEYTAEMLAAFTDEQRTFYGDYFERYNNYVNLFSGTKPVEIFSDGCLLTEFRNAIIDYTPRAMYKCEPLR